MKKHCINNAIVGTLCLLPLGLPATTYNEMYRPQFHLSRGSGSIGDPAGCVRYKNIYHLFTWDHYISSDLVYWAEISPFPMQGGPTNSAYFNGSVAVDTNNTSGLEAPGKVPMVAIYTLHNNSNAVETICLSSTTNSNYSIFNFYSGNPILTSNATMFRDPDVFWYAPTARWIMVVSRSADRRLQFYSSTNLKSWQLQSEFGPSGSQEQIWEVPGMVQLPVDGNPQNQKWVLFCGRGPNKEQYWVGDFDGTNFTVDAATEAYLILGTGLEGQVFADFEGDNYGSWTTTGAAFGSDPAAGALPGQGKVIGYLGSGLANSYHGGDGAVGTLVSPAFTITNRCINFLVGGGNHWGATCINLIVGGNVVASAAGQNDEILRWDGWDVSAWLGQSAHLEIVDNDADNSAGSWGHILVDHIMFADVLRNQNLEQANWVDWGSDFYAARVYRDYDNVEPCPIWIAWMGNWQYATVLPTSWGQGVESIPRNLQLESSPKGYQLVQQPLPRFQKLRGAPVQIGPRIIQGVMSVPEFQPQTNTYEFDAVFNLDSSAQNFGLNLCVGGTNQVVLGYNAETGNVYLDRRASGNVSFSPDFPNVDTAPFAPATGAIEFHVFVDQSSIEVFVNGGQIVMTDVIFPDPASVGFQVFSLNGATTLRSLTAWPLASIWH